ncbi:uncharacterized protein ColSpa_09296 [Colletotrichum spaethianum]|uniref:B box-type domain-containing protein n=1 Tax=Colletotrichum spaethianum TaxID=700344 RepID=A0AA37PBB6_9PEZI|nr:uncharacterized protein ColSpa_09296 [Colletotrichum spaethianum]GKT49115.1 hypothetical protein ColSpa_09296 [Colletotrichum spaethianum]
MADQEEPGDLDQQSLGDQDNLSFDDKQRLKNVPMPPSGSLPNQHHHGRSNLINPSTDTNYTDFTQGMAPEANMGTLPSRYRVSPQALLNHPANANQGGLSQALAPAASMNDFPLQQQDQSYGASLGNMPDFIDATGNLRLQPAISSCSLPRVNQRATLYADHASQPLQNRNGQDITAEANRAANVLCLIGAHGQPGDDINMLGIFPTPEKLLEVLIDACLMENFQLLASSSSPRQLGCQANCQEDMDERSVLKPRDSFGIIFNRACKLGFEEVAQAGGVSFKIATMCSGTDGPILALREFAEAATGHGYANALHYDHVFSVEIDPFKQAFIGRNAPPSGPIFRNVIDVGRPGAVQAMTASGAMADIPTGVDILIAGSSCVDFSSLNIQREKKKRTCGLQKLFEQFEEMGITDVLGQDDPIAEEVIEGLKALFENIEEEKGESTKTFLSILLYVLQHRPKILILENVTKAPWDQFKGFWLPAIGYNASVVQVDSKNFLVPQTRLRKYLVAVDGRRYGNGASDIVNGWAKLMDSSQWFKNPPDLQRFLLPPSDPRVLQARFQLERALLSKPKKDVEAVVCQNDHRLARRNERLGDSHPYTRLDDRGNVQPREESWRGYVFVITPRMQDLLDITCLRSYKKGFDFMFKVLVLDLGQNVDRQGAKLGVMPCVLPSCDPYLTYHGRPVLGLECLAIQGIPIDRISISVEKEAQLKDLAGNAMTTTVAGAAILCAVISERTFVVKAGNQHVNINGLSRADAIGPVETSAVRPELDPPTNEASYARFLSDSSPNFEIYKNDWEDYFNYIDPNVQSSSSAPTITDANISPTSYAKMKWQDALLDKLQGELVVGFLTDLCRKGRRNCLCDAFRKHQHTGTYWRCDDCNEIRCESCTGNPEHNFDKLHSIDATRSIDKSVAYQLATVAFPAHLFVDAFDPDVGVLDGLNDQIFDQHRAALRLAIKACCGSKHYYQTSLKFRDDITVTYDSTDSYITLVVTEKELTWSLHVRQSYFDVADLSLEPNDSTQNAAPLLNSLKYDVRKPLLRAVISDPNASILPMMDD